MGAQASPRIVGAGDGPLMSSAATCGTPYRSHFQSRRAMFRAPSHLHCRGHSPTSFLAEGLADIVRRITGKSTEAAEFDHEHKLHKSINSKGQEACFRQYTYKLINNPISHCCSYWSDQTVVQVHSGSWDLISAVTSLSAAHLHAASPDFLELHSCRPWSMLLTINDRPTNGRM